MKVLVLSDGVPGHDRSSDGVLAALRRLHDISPVWLGIREVRPRSRRLARVAAAFAHPQRWLDASVRSGNTAAGSHSGDIVTDWPASADVVVSTGPSTAAANIAAARRYRASNIYCGFAKFPVVGYSLILSPVPYSGRRVALAPRPTDIDRELLRPPTPLDPQAECEIAVLVGGDTKHYRYTAADFAQLAERLAAIIAAFPRWRLTVFDSRRTPAEPFEALVARLAPYADRCAIHRFLVGGIASNRPAFEADAVIVTADSLSMTTEAIAAGRPTIVVAPMRYHGPARDRQELTKLEAGGSIVRARVDALDGRLLMATPAPPPHSAARALAELLREHGF